MSTNKKLFLILCLIVVIIIGIFIYKNFAKTPIYSTACGNYAERNILIGTTTIKGIIADDYCKRDLGLSWSKNLPDGAGMLFTFDTPGTYGFWMKDMNYPLDTVWISENFSIVGILKDLKPDSYPKVYGDAYTAKYVLELPAGFSDLHGLKIGTPVKF